VQWKQTDLAKLKQLIRKQIVIEITKLEERKLVRRERKEAERKRKLKEEEEIQIQDTTMNKTGNMGRTGGVNFQDKS
jgi:hypothetical protein